MTIFYRVSLSRCYDSQRQVCDIQVQHLLPLWDSPLHKATRASFINGTTMLEVHGTLYFQGWLLGTSGRQVWGEVEVTTCEEATWCGPLCQGVPVLESEGGWGLDLLFIYSMCLLSCKIPFEEVSTVKNDWQCSNHMFASSLRLVSDVVVLSHLTRLHCPSQCGIRKTFWKTVQDS